jgi:hypothetical protein
MTGSAKQSMPQQERMDCFVDPLLAMTTEHISAFSPRVSREFCQQRSALFEKRAWGMPGARRTHSLVCAWELSMHTSIHSEFAEITRHPHAMVYSLFRTLPGDRAFLSPSSAKKFPPT